MQYELPAAGAANEELARSADQWWLAAAARAGIALDGFDPAAALPQRIAWAQGAGLDIATVLSRYSSKLQHSTESQVQANIEFAARQRLYTPPELICVDEGETRPADAPRRTGTRQAHPAASLCHGARGFQG